MAENYKKKKLKKNYLYLSLILWIFNVLEVYEYCVISKYTSIILCIYRYALLKKTSCHYDYCVLYNYNVKNEKIVFLLLLLISQVPII